MKPSLYKSKRALFGLPNKVCRILLKAQGKILEIQSIENKISGSVMYIFI